MTKEIVLLDLFSGMGGFAKGLYGIYNDKVKVIKQTNRYKMIGNAVTKNFPEMIGKRLIENYL